MRARGFVRRNLSLIAVCAVMGWSAAAGAGEGPAPEAAPASAGSLWEPVSFSLECSVYGKYVWRGCDLVDDPVLQPSVSATAGGLKATLWGDMELTDENDHAGEFTELDYTLEYSRPVGPVALAVGAIHYRFPNTESRATTEVYGSVGLLVPLSPTVTVYRDVDETDGTYATFGLKHAVEDFWKPTAGASMSLELLGSVGYGSDKNNLACFGHRESAFDDLLLSARLPVKVGGRWTLTPSVNYETLLDSGIRRSAEHDDNLWAGLTLAVTF